METEEYYSILEELATSAKEEAKKYGYNVYDVIAETVDSCQYVIYTKHHDGILRASTNPHSPESDDFRDRAAAVYLTITDDVQDYL